MLLEWIYANDLLEENMLYEIARKEEETLKWHSSIEVVPKESICFEDRATWGADKTALRVNPQIAVSTDYEKDTIVLWDKELATRTVISNLH